MTQPGIKPATSWSQSRCSTTTPVPCRIGKSHPRGRNFNLVPGWNSYPEGEISLSCIDWLVTDSFSPIFNPWSANHNYCRLLCHLLVILSHFCKQCGPRSDRSFRSSLIRVHTVCLYAKIGLKSVQEYSADDLNRRHFRMQFFLVL